MTILHLVGTQNFAGTEQMVVTICDGQRRRGHRVLAAVRGHSVLEGVLAQRGFDTPVSTVGKLNAVLSVTDVVRREGVDVLHAHLTSGTYAALGASFLTGVPVVVHAHVYNRDLVYRHAAKRGRLIAVSQSTADYYTGDLRVPTSRVVNVPNGSPMRETPEARTSRETLRKSVCEELGLSNDARLLLQAARVTPQKGQDLTVEAARTVVAQRPDVVFLVAGTLERTEFPEFPDQLLDIVRQQGLSANVRFLGFRSDVPRLCRAADMALVPSRYEPFGLGVIEPMLLETPVVAARVGGIAELLDGEEIGRAIEPENAAALAHAILDLLANPEEAKRMAARALAVALERFSVDAMLDRIDAVYQQVVGSPVVRMVPNADQTRRG